MPEEKVRFQMHISPDTDRQVKALMPKANCQSQNEFVENALKFYCAYLTTQDTTEFLPPIFVHAMQGTIQCSENRISRLLFKLTVELSMMMNVLAAGLEIDNSQLDALRWRCVQEVKKTNGSISFKDVLKREDNGGFE